MRRPEIKLSGVPRQMSPQLALGSRRSTTFISAMLIGVVGETLRLSQIVQQRLVGLVDVDLVGGNSDSVIISV